jgi:excinuclease ABC subunit A
MPTPPMPLAPAPLSFGQSREPQIQLRGVRTHNLKAIDLDLPLNRLVAITGISGSGKSSLAIDTLYAEGQRRYVETFSPYLRQFLERLEKPPADAIEGLPPAVAIASQAPPRPGRSTLATLTEIHNDLAIVFTKLGRVLCRVCRHEVKPATPERVAQAIDALPEGSRYLIAAPVDVSPRTDLDALARLLREDGLSRLMVAGRTIDLGSEPIPPLFLKADTGTERAEIDVIIDRLIRGREAPGRRIDSIEIAFRKGFGRCRMIPVDAAEPKTFVQGWQCGHCGTFTIEPQPELFQDNQPLGACPECEGLGIVVDANGQVRPCPACGGMRLRPEALAVELGGRNIADLLRLTPAEAAAFLTVERLGLRSEASSPSSDGSPSELSDEAMLATLRSRLSHIVDVGLGYLSLDRPAHTLSKGEHRRATLARVIGAGLVNTLFVLDEPTSGLHPGEVESTVLLLKRLRDGGNTVLVVEHDPAVIRNADRVIDLGPGAGHAGGEIVFTGDLETFLQSQGSPTADFVSGRSRVWPPRTRRSTDKGRIRLIGASRHNLQSIDVEIPLGVLCVVTGVSGSGKSTLVEETLYPALRHRFDPAAPRVSDLSKLLLDGPLTHVVLVDPAPIGRSGRSNPVTYVKAFDEIRKTFAATHDAKLRNYRPSHFSFNVDGGRCNACRGEGYRTIDMQFLPDVVVRCPECGGSRYRSEILEVSYRGRNIAEVLAMTAREALAFFRHRPKVQARLRPLLEIGLDYLTLGQPASTLSSGEAQRLKLAGVLAATASAANRADESSRTLFILDEPTDGLHPLDVLKLLDVLNALVDRGHSVLVVEHSPDIMIHADWILDLGPGAGPAGGRVVAQGTPETVARSATATGTILALSLGSGGPNASAS